MSTLTKNISTPQSDEAFVEDEVQSVGFPTTQTAAAANQIIDRLANETPPSMLLREIVCNEMDAIVEKQNHPDYKNQQEFIYITSIDDNLACVGTGIGFTEDNITDNFLELFNSSKVGMNGDLDQCIGAGARIASKRHTSLSYKTKNFETEESFKFIGTTNSNNEWGLKKFYRDDVPASMLEINDSDFQFLDQLPAEIRSLEVLEGYSFDSGTEVILAGNKQNPKTWPWMNDVIQRDWKSGNLKSDKTGWPLVKWINSRWFINSNNIKIIIDRCKSGNNTTYLANGAKHWLDHKCIDSGNFSVNKIDNDHDNLIPPHKIHWWISEQGKDNALNALNHHAFYFPIFGLMHKNELYYDSRYYKTRQKHLRNCGLGNASKRVSFIIEFESERVSVTTSRDSLRIDGNAINQECYDLIEQNISENLPKEITDFIDELNRSLPVEHFYSQKNLKKHLREKFGSVKTNPTGSAVITSNWVISGSSGGAGPGTGNGNSGGGGNPTNDSNPLGGTGNGNVYHLTNGPTKPRRRSALQRVKNTDIPEPQPNYTMEKEEWTYLDWSTWTLYYNPDFDKIETIAEINYLSNNHVIGGLICKTVEKIFNTIYFNDKATQSEQKKMLTLQKLTEEAWLSKSEIAEIKRNK
tara:strand:+ start:74 stop:1984 length:1911 start_codon:yes stop_codon:yes gene_type:complete